MLPYWRLSSFYFFYFAFVGVMAPYWPLYLRELGYSALQIGVLMSLLQVMRIFAPNLWGHLADRTGRRVWIVQLATFASLLGFLIVFWRQDFWALFAMMSIVSFFWSASLPLVEANTLTHLGDRTEHYGRIRLWGSVGFILVVIGLGAALDHLPLTILPWSVLVLLVGIVATARFMPEAVAPRQGPDGESLRRALRQPAVIALLGAAILMAAAHGPYYTFFSVHLIESGYSKSATGWLWALGVVVEIGVFLVMPRVFRRVRPATVMLITLLAAALRFVLIGWMVQVTALLLLAQVLHALTFGAYHAAAMALVHRWFTGRIQARGQAVYNSISFGIGGSLGSLYSGAVWDGFGAGVTFSIAAACALLAAMVFWRHRSL
jgi:PPP family 3-phenylpropionic acid transporter